MQADNTERGRTPPRLTLLLMMSVILLGTLPLFFVDLSTLFGGRHPPQEFSQFAHVGFFALLSLLALPCLRRRTPARIGITLVVIFLISVTIEAGQLLSDRDASLNDLLLNASGIILGLGLFSVLHKPHLTGVAMAITAFTLWQPTVDLWDRWRAYQQFPVLSDFSTRFEHRRWSYGERTLLSSGEYALQISLAADKFPGTWMHRSLGDWSDSDCLHLILQNPDADPLVLNLSIRDHAHEARGERLNDRFSKSFELPPGRHRAEIAVSAIKNAPAQRELDLANVSRLVLFTNQPAQPRELLIERVSLSSKAGKHQPDARPTDPCDAPAAATVSPISVSPTPAKY